MVPYKYRTKQRQKNNLSNLVKCQEENKKDFLEEG